MAGLALAVGLAAPARADDAAAELVADFETAFLAGEDVVAELSAMAARDQYLRATFIARMQQAPTEAVRQDYIDATEHYFDRVDGENTERLKEILARFGWAELTALSPDAADHAFQIVSHTNDTAFKERVVEEIEPLVRAGEMDAERYAMFVDDLLLAQTGKQRYATNFDCIAGEWRPMPTEEPATLDARRADMGLAPLEQYRGQIQQVYGACPEQ